MTKEAIRVVVVDDHPMFREGVVSSLKKYGDVTVVGEANSGEEALCVVCEMLPDIVLLDVSMPGWGNPMTIEKITAACPATAIIILTASEDRDALLAAFKAGARGFVLKGVAAQELGGIIRAVSNGEAYVSPNLAADVLLSMREGRAPDYPQALTAREREILELIGKGLTNKVIGERLTLSEKTIKHYVTSILNKLQVRSRVEAALIAAAKR